MRRQAIGNKKMFGTQITVQKLRYLIDKILGEE